MEVVSLCAGHREMVQSTLEELNTMYSTRLEVLLSSETLDNNNTNNQSSASTYQIAAHDILNGKETKNTEFLSQYLPSLSNDDGYDGDNLNNYSTIQSPYQFPTAATTNKKINKQQQQSNVTAAAVSSKHVNDKHSDQLHHLRNSTSNHYNHQHRDKGHDDNETYDDDGNYSMTSSDALVHDDGIHATTATVSPTYSASLDYNDIYPHDSAVKDEVRWYR